MHTTLFLVGCIDLKFVNANNSGIQQSNQQSSGIIPSLLLLNATSLAKPSAVQLLESEIKQSNCQIALITETWFTDRHTESVVSIYNFQLFRRDRGRRGGGVCAYDSNELQCHTINLNDFNDQVKILWLQCCSRDQMFYIACCYHPPKPCYNSMVFIETLSSNIEAINSENSHPLIIIAGDFNLQFS